MYMSLPSFPNTTQGFYEWSIVLYFPEVLLFAIRRYDWKGKINHSNVLSCLLKRSSWAQKKKMNIFEMQKKKSLYFFHCLSFLFKTYTQCDNHICWDWKDSPYFWAISLVVQTVKSYIHHYYPPTLPHPTPEWLHLHCFIGLWPECTVPTSVVCSLGHSRRTVIACSF
jgi:hypothetical protein